jgi:hypothetical protein
MIGKDKSILKREDWPRVEGDDFGAIWAIEGMDGRWSMEGQGG